MLKAEDLYNSVKTTRQIKMLICCRSKNQALKQSYLAVRGMSGLHGHWVDFVLSPRTRGQ